MTRYYKISYSGYTKVEAENANEAGNKVIKVLRTMPSQNKMNHYYILDEIREVSEDIGE